MPASFARMVFFWLLVCCASACFTRKDPTEFGPSPQQADQESSDLVGQGCGMVTSAVTPVPAAAFVAGSYNGRAFLSPANHLGEDVAMPEGSPVVAIAAGTVKFAGPASGYGDLLVAIEHHTLAPITVISGDGGMSITTDVFLTIYGHLRPSAVYGGPAQSLSVGSCVAAGQVVGFVNDDAHNGDGAEHVHVGVRLMSDAVAHALDGSTAYRGYDTPNGAWKDDFASAHDLLAVLSAAPTWHPDGTLVQVAGKPEIYRLEWGLRRHVEDEISFTNAHLYTGGQGNVWNRVVAITDAELSCYQPGFNDVFPQPMRVVTCVDGTYLVPGVGGMRTQIGAPFGTSIYTELLRSWGFVPGDVVPGGASECALPKTFTQLLLRDGTLVKEQGTSTVYVIADGIAWPIDSWDTFLALGFFQANIQTIPDGTLAGYVYWVSAYLLDASFLNRCMATLMSSCNDPICIASFGGGSGEPDPSDGAGGAGGEGDGGSANSSSSGGPPPCVPAVEICNNQDDDCDGVVDNGFLLEWDAGNCGACGVSCSRQHSQYGCVQGMCEWWGCDPGWANTNGNWNDGCEAPACVPSAEVCNGVDDNCDGQVDEGGVCLPQPQVGHKVRVAFSATNCLNTDIAGGWPSVCSSGSFDNTWLGVMPGLKRMNAAVGGTWVCNEPNFPGNAQAPLGLPQAWVDDVPATVIVTHDWRLSWGCNLMLCVGDACEMCCDGIDNDLDGKTDLADPDCADAVACF
jgi:murein DD-endopeptidase MepM/ murein hydrolase activator NlpD